MPSTPPWPVLKRVRDSRQSLANVENHSAAQRGALRSASIRAVEAGWSVTAVAEAAGVARKTMHEWLNDAKRKETK